MRKSHCRHDSVSGTPTRPQTAISRCATVASTFQIERPREKTKILRNFGPQKLEKEAADESISTARWISMKSRHSGFKTFRRVQMVLAGAGRAKIGAANGGCAVKTALFWEFFRSPWKGRQ